MSKQGHILYALFLCLLYILAVSVFASQDYDLNTEITLEGTILSIVQGRRGPLTFIIESEHRIYHIITGPRWYIKEIDLQLEKDIKVEVTGSKLYDRQGNLYLLLYSLKDIKSNKTYHFRDDALEPLWQRGHRNRYNSIKK